MDKKIVIAQIKHELEKHPGDAPWSCTECYHGRECVDKEILLAASYWLGVEQKLNQKRNK